MAVDVDPIAVVPELGDGQSRARGRYRLTPHPVQVSTPDADRGARYLGAAALVVAVVAAALVASSLVLRPGLWVWLVAVVLAVVLVRAVVRPLWAVALFVLAIPVGLDEQLTLGPVKVVQLVGALVVVLVVLHRLVAGQAPLGWHPSARWAVLLVALAMVASITARDPLVALRETVTLGVAVGLSLAVKASCPRPTDVRRVALLLAVVGAGVCLSTLGDASSIQAVVDNPASVDNRALGIFQSPNQLGTFSGIVLFVSLAVVFGSPARLERVLGCLTAISALAALLLSLSRGSWLGVLLGFGVLLVLSPRARRVLPVAVLVAVVAGPPVLERQIPALWSVFQQRGATVIEMQANPEDARPLAWQEAQRQIAQRPLTGQGPGAFPIASETPESVTPTLNLAHAHDVLLNVAAEAGVPAAAALVALTISTGRRVLQARRRLPGPDRELLAALSCALVVLVGQGVVDFTLGNSALLMLSFVVLGLVFAVSSPQRVPDAGASSEGDASAVTR